MKTKIHIARARYFMDEFNRLLAETEMTFSEGGVEEGASVSIGGEEYMFWADRETQKWMLYEDWKEKEARKGA